MPDPTSCCRAPGGYCQRCDVLVGLDGLHVIGVERDDGAGSLRVRVESRRPDVMGCPTCGVVAHAHGRQQVELIDAPCFTATVRLLWNKRRWRCPELLCPVTSFMEQDPAVSPVRGLLTRRAVGWAIGQMRQVERLGARFGQATRLLLEDTVAGRETGSRGSGC